MNNQSHRDVFIIGAGPSLCRFPFDKLKGRNTFAVKAVGEYLPWADFWFSMDANMIEQRLRRLKDFLGTKILAVKEGFNINQPYFDDVNFILKDNVGTIGFSWRSDCVYGKNSGFSCANFAATHGFKNIYLLGLDFTIGGYWYDMNSQHWINPRRVNGELEYRRDYINECKADFAIANKQCIERGINLISVGGYIPELQSVSLSVFIDLL